MSKGGVNMANSTAVAPLAHKKSPCLLGLAIAQSILIQLVMLMEVQPKAPTTLTPNNG
jgi:hypothetical protein